MVPNEGALTLGHVGLLVGSSLSQPSPLIAALVGALRQKLRDLGWTEGTNLMLEQRAGEGRPERLPDLASELVGLPVDVLVTTGTTETLAAKSRTTTVPIVFYNIADPVGAGLVGSLASPAGNLTGVSRQGPAVYAKGLEILRQLLPQMSRAAVIWNPSNVASQLALAELKRTADALGVELQPFEINTPNDIDPAFASAADFQADGLLWLNDTGPLALSTQRIVDLAAQYQIPAYHPTAETVRAGGLLTYGPSDLEQGYLAAEYVDRILRGAHPADLPVQQPTRFDFVMNVTTAKTLGINLAPDVAAQVTEWVQ
jgi:putative ABC transport system substrate-binding protein